MADPRSGHRSVEDESPSRPTSSRATIRLVGVRGVVFGHVGLGSALALFGAYADSTIILTCVTSTSSHLYRHYNCYQSCFQQYCVSVSVMTTSITRITLGENRLLLMPWSILLSLFLETVKHVGPSYLHRFALLVS